MEDIFKQPNKETAYKELVETCIDLQDDKNISLYSTIKNWEYLLTFYEFLQKYWKYIYTTNIIENMNKTIWEFTNVSIMELN